MIFLRTKWPNFMQNFHILCTCPRLDPTGGYQIKVVGGVRKKVGGVNPPRGCRKIPGSSMHHTTQHHLLTSSLVIDGGPITPSRSPASLACVHWLWSVHVDARTTHGVTVLRLAATGVAKNLKGGDSRLVSLPFPFFSPSPFLFTGRPIHYVARGLRGSFL